MPLTLASCGSMFDAQEPGVVVLAGRRAPSRPIILTAQGSRLDAHHPSRRSGAGRRVAGGRR